LEIAQPLAVGLDLRLHLLVGLVLVLEAGVHLREVDGTSGIDTKDIFVIHCHDLTGLTRERPY
jgi:hypothetical protein